MSRLEERFPALERLRPRVNRKRVPYVPQTAATDCGPACLTMVLRYHGRNVRLDEVRTATATSRDGSSALTLVQAAHHFGLRGRGLSIDIDELKYLTPGTVLHWGFSHFVVFERLGRSSIEIVDPAAGRSIVPMEEVRRRFTGVAIEFEPRPEFTADERGVGRTWQHVRRLLAHSGLLGHVIVISSLVQLFGLGTPLLTGMLVDRVVPRGDVGLLQVIAVGLGGIVAFSFLASLIRSHLLLYLRTQVDVQMMLGFLDHLVELPFAFFQTRSAGDLIMRLNSNATVREILTQSALSAALDGVLVVSYLAMIFIVSPFMGTIVLVLGALRVAVFLFTRRRITDLMRRHLSVQAASQGYQVQILAGIETLKAAGAEQRAVERWSGLYVDVLNASLARGRLNAWLQSVIHALGVVSPFAVLFAGALLVMDGRLSLGTMLALVALAAGFLTPLSALVRTALQLQELGSYVERIDDVLSTPKEQDASKVVSAPVLQGRITLEHVSFRYAPVGPPAIDDVSLDIRPGEMVAIVGRSAAGKTTLANLIMALYRPSSGRILYDGVDLVSLDVKSIRRQLGIVTQQSYLFGASIRENIALSDPNTPIDDVIAAARLAQIHDEITQMPMGYDTVVVDGGASLSGGQRQRLAIARSLVGSPAVLLLDEATSSLDAETERDIQRAITEIRCTRIVIAHRMSTVQTADRIVVLQRGQIVEEGRHDDLVNAGGPYRSLLAAQLTTPSRDEG